MKIANIKKLICYILALFLALSVSAFLLSTASVKADTTTDYFTFDADGTAVLDGDAGVLILNLGDGETATFKRKLVIDDFAMELTVAGSTSIEVNFVSAAYDPNAEDVTNTVTLAGTGNKEVHVSVTDCIFSNTGDGNFVINSNKIEQINFATATISIKATGEGTVSIKSIDQKRTDADNKYKQLFTTDAIANPAYVRVALNNGFTSRYKYSGKLYTVSYVVYNVLPDGVTSSSISMKLPDTAEEGTINILSNKIQFNLKDGETEAARTFYLNDGTNNIETMTVTVKDKSADTEAPRYLITDPTSTEMVNFVNACKELLVSEGTYGDDDAVYVSLSSSSYLSLPSMRALVRDEYTSYDDLKYTIYYANESTSGFSTYSSAFKVPLSAAGDLKLFIAFKDLADNTMEKDDFYKLDNNDSNIIKDGNIVEYKNLIFSFTVVDNAPLQVTAATTQAAGYVGVSKTASSFTITALNYTTTYTLYYNASTSATSSSSGWIEIPKASDITDEDYSENGYTYDDIQDIAYDGSLTFTPNKIGAYMIECSVASNSSARAAQSSTIITVGSKPTVVVPDTHWLQNNVWSVVFLSVGTLCLIAIIVLLFIKPKEQTADSEPKEKKKSKRNKKA